MQCFAAASTAGACATAGFKAILEAPTNPAVKGGMAAGAALACAFGSIVAIGKCEGAAYNNGGLDADENAALGLVYRAVFMDLKAYSPASGNGGVDGGDSIKAFGSGSAGLLDATGGGAVNYLTGSFANMPGIVHVVHA